MGRNTRNILDKKRFRVITVVTFAALFNGMDKDVQRIYGKTFELCKQFGIKGVTMDQVSQACGMSKKTLYKYVANKEDLLLQVFDFLADTMQMEIGEALQKRHGNAIDRLFALESFAEGRLRGDEDQLLFQLGHFYPELALHLKKRREEIVFGFTKANLQEGIEQGLYREDLQVDHIALLYYGHILAVHENIISEQALDTVALRQTSLRYHIRGIASAKGLEYLHQLIPSK